MNNVVELSVVLLGLDPLLILGTQKKQKKRIHCSYMGPPRSDFPVGGVDFVGMSTCLFLILFSSIHIICTTSSYVYKTILCNIDFLFFFY